MKNEEVIASVGKKGNSGNHKGKRNNLVRTLAVLEQPRGRDIRRYCCRR